MQTDRQTDRPTDEDSHGWTVTQHLHFLGSFQSRKYNLHKGGFFVLKDLLCWGGDYKNTLEDCETSFVEIIFWIEDWRGFLVLIDCLSSWQGRVDAILRQKDLSKTVFVLRLTSQTPGTEMKQQSSLIYLAETILIYLAAFFEFVIHFAVSCRFCFM